jgi:hypothetical protein
MTKKVSLMVNDEPISLDYFVEGFIDHTTGGIIAALEGTGEIKDLELTIDGQAVGIKLNGADVPLNPFVTTIIRSTVAGMLTPLKGVRDVSKVKLNINRG